MRQLHQKALATGERDLLFALAEMSYVAGDHIRRSVKPWDPRDARDYYLGSAVYAWLFLFGEGKEPPPGAFDRRFREACDFYNYSLGLALTERQEHQRRRAAWKTPGAGCPWGNRAAARSPRTSRRGWRSSTRSCWRTNSACAA